MGFQCDGFPHLSVPCSEQEAKENAKKFESEDIGDILAQRTSKRIMRGGGKAGGGTFSVASFKQDDGVTNGAAPYPAALRRAGVCRISTRKKELVTKTFALPKALVALSQQLSPATAHEDA